MSEAQLRDVFVIVHKDRHCDTGVEVWLNENAAIERAKDRAREFCRFDEDFREGLTDLMREAGWLYYATYSCEGDSVRVVKAEVHR